MNLGLNATIVAGVCGPRPDHADRPPSRLLQSQIRVSVRYGASA